MSGSSLNLFLPCCCTQTIRPNNKRDLRNKGMQLSCPYELVEAESLAYSNTTTALLCPGACGLLAHHQIG